MSGIVSTIAVVASVITGLTVIITAGIKVFKFIQKVTNKLEVLDKIEKTEKDRETIDKDFKSMEQGIKDIYEITTPSGRKLLPPTGTSWRFSKENFEKLGINI